MGRDGRRPRRRWLVVLAWVAGTLTVLLGGGVLWLWLQLSGGWPVPETRPDDDRVVAAREAWQPVWDARQAGLVADLEQTGLVVLGVNTSDTCRAGQNNWKVRDGYGLQCTFTHRVVLGARTADLTELVTDVHGTVTAGDLDGALGPDSSRTLLTELARYEPHHDRVGAGSYRGDLTVDGVQNLVWSSVGVAREPTTYSLDTVLWAPEPVHATAGPSVRELQRAEREWLGGGRDAWLVTATTRMPYFTR